MTFLALAAATLASEDLACIGAGLLVSSGKVDWWTAVGACAAGIYAGDLAYYAAGRWLRPGVHRWQKARAWFEKSGSAAVFASRFMPGFRVATYLAAGALRMPFGQFAATLGLAVILWATALVSATAWLGRAPVLWWLAAPAVLFWGLRNTRWSRWEFWPAWLAYAPVVPYVLWQALKHRSLTLFKWANPSMKNGGLVGESKSESLARLSRSAAFTLVTDRRPPRIDQFPVVLKPDVGERGNGVKIARTQADVDAYDFSRPVIVQEYVEGEEFGLYYYNGQLLSITRKLFPRVTGDGIRTVRELVEADDRARLIAGAYRASCDFAAVPAAGEQVQLVEIGSHCRGTVFLDGRSLWTPALADAVDRQAKMHEGFQLGRFDVRAPSVEALQRGEFRVLELNGVGAEPAHIYDPSVSLVEAYRALFRHWRFAYEAGAVFKKRQG